MTGSTPPTLFAVVLATIIHTALTVQEFTREPEDQIVFQGGAVIFTCSVSDKVGQQTWLRSGVPLNYNNFVSVTDARYSIVSPIFGVDYHLQILDVAFSDQAVFQCTVTQFGSDPPLLSREATLTVIPATQQVFTEQPSSVTVVQGNDVTLNCVVNDKEGTLEWTKDGVTISSDDTIDNGNARLSIDGDQAAGEYNLKITSTITSDSGTYGCIVRAAGSSAEIGPAEAELTVGLQQSFITEPQDITATVGDTLSLSCSVSDKGGSVNWLQGSTVLTSDYTVLTNLDSRVTVLDNGNSGVTYDLQIIDSIVSDTAEYKCSVTSTEFGHVAIEATAQVTVSEPVIQKFTVEPQNTQTSVDQSATLFCTVENIEGTLSWFKDDVSISSDRDITNGDSRLSIVGDESSGEYNLRVLSATESDEGDYYCLVTAAGGSSEIISSVANLDVNSEGQRLGDLPSDVSPKVSSDVTLPCSVVNRNGNVLWLQNGQSVSTNRVVADSYSDRFSIIGNETQDEFYLLIEDIQLDDAGSYTCAVTGTPSTSYTVTVTVEEAEAPDSGSPQCFGPSNDLNEGDEIMLICSSQGGDPPATLTWSKDGQEVASEPVETQIGVKIGVPLTLGYDDQGDVYTCTSSHVTYSELKTCQLPALQINLIPRIAVDVEPSILEITEGAQGTFTCNATGDPPVTAYTWYYNSQAINSTDRRFEHDEGRTVLRVISAEKSMDDAKIWCTASNAIDRQTATASINLVDQTIEEDDTLSFRFLAAVVALIAGIIVAAIVIAVIIYCVIKKRRERDDEDEEGDKAPVVQTQEQAAVRSDVGSGRKGLSVPPNGNMAVLTGSNYFVNNRSNKKSLPPVRNGHPNSGQESVHYDIVYEKSGRDRRRSRKQRKPRIIKHNVVDPLNDRKGTPPPSYDDHDKYERPRDRKDGSRSRHRSHDRERDRDSSRRSRSRSSRRREESPPPRRSRESRKSRRDDDVELDRFRRDDDKRRSRRRDDERRDDRRDRDDRHHRRSRSASETRSRSERDRDEDKHRARSSDRRSSKRRDRSYDEDDRPRSRDKDRSYDRDDRREKERRSRKDRY
ncbi:hemicentin-1-like isoform X2 [Ptychodera flava]|uniref:hemicentin-1-like isoform X2 n=1 Tax=Ptychodera flava TaxID=63121 RepID=UPI003969E26D